MRKIITIFSGIVCLLLLTAVTVTGQPWVPVAGTHIYNPNNAGNGFVGIGTNAAPGKLLDVYRNTTEPTIRVYNLGGLGGATFEMTDVVSGANWKFKATNAGGFKIRDNTFGLDVINVAPNSAANSICIAGLTGDVGLGTNFPIEKLHVVGAINLGNTPNNNPGTIKWDGANFLGHNAFGWEQLNNGWVVIPNVPFANPEYFSPPQPMSLSFAFPGIPNPLARLYVTDMTAPALFPHQIAIETITAGAGAANASQLYRISAGMNPPFIDYSAGIFGGDGTYKICFNSVLTATAQSDNTTMLRANPMGIIDLPNQSRVRAYHLDPSGALFQTIPPLVWTPVNFTFDTPLPVGYDEQNEFTLSPAVNTPAMMENAYFTATQEGYYQVNARCEFNVDYYVGGPVMLSPNSYVSIAIWAGAGPGFTSSYAIGNNLQIGYANGPVTGILFSNNAPNVSDVVYLIAGQIISIWLYHSALTPMDLIQNSNKVYVSIHKVS